MLSKSTQDLLEYEYLPERLLLAGSLAVQGRMHSNALLMVQDHGEVRTEKLGFITRNSIAWCNPEPNVWVIVKMPSFLHHYRDHLEQITFNDEQIAITKLGGDWITLIMDEYKKNQEIAK